MPSDRPSVPPLKLPRFARLLPRRARQEWFAPALADLRAEYHERRLDSPSSTPPLRLRAWYGLSVAWMFIETLRLAAQQGLRHLIRPAHQGARTPRKDWPAMLIRDVRGALRIFRREPAFAAIPRAIGSFS
jgi:hypothetical protein